MYASQRAFKADERDPTLRNPEHRIDARFGTRFNGADVSGADFRRTNVAHADMSGAVTVGVTCDERAGPRGWGTLVSINWVCFKRCTMPNPASDRSIPRLRCRESRFPT